MQSSSFQQQQQQQPQPYKIVDDYVIYQDKMLGNGTYGTVYQGINKNTKENVAVKVIPIKKIEKECQNPAQIFQQIRNEIQNMQLIEGQHIVRLIDKKKSSNSIYLILEFCNGGNLQGMLKANQGSLSESQAVNIIYQITEGYKCLLAKNMAHRDLKPANILFKDGMAKIADFGFSKVVGLQDDSKLRHSILGSPQYMSPQLLSCQEYCPKKADMWSLGMLFFEILYRKVPWRADSPMDLLTQITSKPLEFPAVPQVSVIVKKVITYMLKVEESDRISWEELINEPLFESQTKLDFLLQSLNSLELRFMQDSFIKMKEYCRLYIEQNRVFHTLFECRQKEQFNKHIIDCNLTDQNFAAFSDSSLDSTNHSGANHSANANGAQLPSSGAGLAENQLNHNHMLQQYLQLQQQNQPIMMVMTPAGNMPLQQQQSLGSPTGLAPATKTNSLTTVQSNNVTMISNNNMNNNSGFSDVSSSNSNNNPNNTASNQVEMQSLLQFSICMQYRQLVINNLSEYFLRKRNKGIFFAHLAILLSDIYEARNAHAALAEGLTESIMLSHVFTLFKKGYLKIYKTLRRVKLNDADGGSCKKFSLDDYKSFEQSNERAQLRKYFNFDLNMLKCLFDELLQKVNAFVKKSLPQCPAHQRTQFEIYQTIMQNTMNEKDKFDPIFKTSAAALNQTLKAILKNIHPNEIQDSMRPLALLAFYVSQIDQSYALFKYANNLDYSKFYETYERSPAKNLATLVLNSQ